MFTLRKSVSYALAGSILLAAAACQKEAPSPTAPDSPTLARGPKPPKPPTGQLNLRVTANTSWSVSFAWDPVTNAASYRIRDNWNREISVPGTQTSVTWKYPHPPLQAGATYSFSAKALSATGTTLASSGTVTVSLPLDNIPPTVPAFSVTSVGTRHISLTWLSTDDSPFISYQVFKDGVKVHTGWISATSRTFTLLQPATTYTFTALARDYFENVEGGNTSDLSPPFSVTTNVNDGSDVTAPTQPTPVNATLFGDGSTEMNFSWGGSTDDVTPQNVIIYEIYVNGVLENTAIGTTHSSGYGVFGENVITVFAIDEAGNRSTAGTTTIFI